MITENVCVEESIANGSMCEFRGVTLKDEFEWETVFQKIQINGYTMCIALTLIKSNHCNSHSWTMTYSNKTLYNSKFPSSLPCGYTPTKYCYVNNQYQKRPLILNETVHFQNMTSKITTTISNKVRFFYDVFRNKQIPPQLLIL